MRDKEYRTSIFVVICILMNCFGKFISEYFSLPEWLDSFGTVLSAYVLDSVCGAMVGITFNIIYAIANAPVNIYYVLVSFVVAVIAGHAGEKGYLNTLFGAMTAGFMTAVISTMLLIPFNYYNFNGYTGNLWGDGVIHILEKSGFIKLFASFAGQLYLDFSDKAITFVTLFFIIKIYKYMNKLLKRKAPALWSNVKGICRKKSGYTILYGDL